MKSYKAWLGLIVLIVMGFLAYVAVTGVGILVAIVVMVFPWWQIVIGTCVGTVGVYLHLKDKWL